MAREKSKNNEKAREIYMEYSGNITNKEIAIMINEDQRKISVWKKRGNWARSDIKNNIIKHKTNFCKKDMHTNCIYRFLNKKGEVIYIGKATNLENRITNHRHLPKQCYEETETIEVATFNTEYDMDFAERYYVPKFKPIYNGMMRLSEITLNIKEFDEIKWTKCSSNIINKIKEQ